MLILNGTVFTDGKLARKDIRIKDGKFVEIAEPGELTGLGDGTFTDEQVLDATDKYILPGLVDVHTHGRIGEDFSRITEEGLQKLLASYAECGVTAVLGTTMTNEPSLVENSLRLLGEHGREQKKTLNPAAGLYRSAPGAKLLGIHMEGPFLGAEKKGAHKEEYLKNPDWDWLRKMQRLSNERIRLVTIDPGLPQAEEFIKSCSENGIKVSLGHTACDYETAVRAQAAGADHVTHTFNAMNPLHHREPGLIGAAMDTNMYMELICDGIHVHPSVIRMMFDAHPDRILLISDSISAAGLKDGDYESGGVKVTVKSGRATLPDGTIAGSTISLFDALVNAIRFGVPAELAINSATYLPAKSVGMENVVGSIAVGRDAECFVVDKEWKPEKIFLT